MRLRGIVLQGQREQHGTATLCALCGNRVAYKTDLTLQRPIQASNTCPARAPSWCSTSPRSSNSRRSTTRLKSVGSFNLQPQVTVHNNQNAAWSGTDYELIVMVMIDALQKQPYIKNEARNMVNGGFLDNIRSGMGWTQSRLW